MANAFDCPKCGAPVKYNSAEQSNLATIPCPYCGETIVIPAEIRQQPSVSRANAINPQDLDKPFLMPVDDVFTIKGRGTVVTGRVQQGRIHVGDAVEIVRLREKSLNSVCTGIEMFHKVLSEGKAGDNLGLMLRGIDSKDLKRGMVIAKPGSIKPQS